MGWVYEKGKLTIVFSIDKPADQFLITVTDFYRKIINIIQFCPNGPRLMFPNFAQFLHKSTDYH